LQILIPASVYTIIAASAERYVSSKEKRINYFAPWRRVVIICAALLFAICIKVCHIALRPTVTGASIIMVTTDEECNGFGEYHLIQSSITSSWLYSTIWMFWARNIFTVFLPFTLLFFLNWATRRNMSFERTDLLLSEHLSKVIPRFAHLFTLFFHLIHSNPPFHIFRQHQSMTRTHMRK
uniref:G-protein coupled receptors family 1 profile domain-containing protein n=1 Tax=Parascaris equorum TaxID=6256 RepID=A0A914RVA0_PAREQ